MTLSLVYDAGYGSVYGSYLGLAATSAWQNALSWSTLGYLCVAVGMLATLLSPYRYLLAYLVAGMLYWLLVEGLQWAIVSMVAISSWHGYIAALALTWLLPSVFFVYRLAQQADKVNPKANLKVKGQRSESSRAYFLWHKPKIKQENYIEHTPIYKNYKPRFPS